MLESTTGMYLGGCITVTLETEINFSWGDFVQFISVSCCFLHKVMEEI
jgi:hypothetical protein